MSSSLAVSGFAASVLAVSVLTHGVPSAPTPQAAEAEPHFAIPLSLLAEHAELYMTIEQASRLNGRTGEAARRVLVLLKPHVAKEQRDAFPLLRLLPALGQQRVEPWMTELLPLGDRLRAEMPSLIEEHGELTVALAQLADAAWSDDHSQYAFLAQRLRRHLKLEEEILYPAALLVADTVRSRMAS